MFAGAPKFSEEDLRRGEAEAFYTVQQFTTMSALLYLSPFVIEAVWKLF